MSAALCAVVRMLDGGCWMVDAGCGMSINSLPTVALSQVAEELLTLAYESGINFFDTAEVYAAGK